jgi:Putative adhesin
MPLFVRTQSIEHPIGAGGRFALRVTSPDVEINGSDDSVARVRVTLEIRAGSEAEADELLEEARFRVKEGDGSLEVTEPRHGDTGLNALARIFGLGRSATASVEVTLPRAAEVECDGVSADITATDLTGSQRWRTVSGDIVLDRVSGAIRIQAVSGDVSLRAIGPVALDANAVSGDLSAFAPAFDAARVVTVSGDVELEGELARNGSHRIETVSGDLSLGVVDGLVLEVRGLSTDVDVSVPHRAEGSRDRRRYVIGAGGPQVMFSSMSGDVSVGSGRRSGTSSPVPPVPPIPPLPAAPAGGSSRSALEPDEQLAVLQALERGEIDVDEAARRLGGGRADA